MLILTPKGILAARDRLGRTPLIVGKKEDACCVSFESFAYLNLGYEDLKELGRLIMEKVYEAGARDNASFILIQFWN